MGSLFRMTFYAPDKTRADAAAVAAFERVEELNRIMSDYDPQSELMQLCRRPVGEPTGVSEDLFSVLQTGQQLSERSDGAFDVTVGPLVQLWRAARKQKVLPTENQIAQARKAVGWKKLKLDSRLRTATLLAPDMRLDLGGIAKGFAADEALEVLKGRRVNRAMVAASGDLALGDPPPGQRGWRIGVAEIGAAVPVPLSAEARRSQAASTLLLRNCGISTSGDTEQFIELGGVRYSHIVSPQTGLGLTNRIQATVSAPDAIHSDALATTVCILGPKRGIDLIHSFAGTSVLVTSKDVTGEKISRTGRFEKKD